MLKDRTQLEEYLTNQFQKLVFNRKQCLAIYEMAENKYNIPLGTVADIVAMRVSATELNYFMLFAMTDLIESIPRSRKIVKEYFTEQEISTYSTTKYERDTIKFPLRYKMIQVSDDQWIGTIDMQEIVRLCKAQLLAYNANTQRAMQMNIIHGQRVYKPSLNQNAVKSIKETMGSGIYIPNTLTFNILDEDDFYYDSDSCELVIHSLSHFDITDGYHRYQAMMKLVQDNPSFNIKMELRITNFNEDKARQFIYQEDQKTKMKKVDSDAMDNYNAGNRVVSKVNESRSCNLQGEIKPQNGLINPAEMGAIINQLFFKGKGKTETRTLIPQVTKMVINGINDVTDNAEYISHVFTAREILLLMYLVQKQEENIEAVFDTIVKNGKLANVNYNAARPAYKKVLDQLAKLVEEVK